MCLYQLSKVCALLLLSNHQPTHLCCLLALPLLPAQVFVLVRQHLDLAQQRMAVLGLLQA